mmetsp:Transcript_22348/g.62705  ORF Transcript_22348/g.62705 Transcript_22348/m.62705 type:complete len:201 (+) Transcript_22348:1444-2046(+)
MSEDLLCSILRTGCCCTLPLPPPPGGDSPSAGVGWLGDWACDGRLPSPPLPGSASAGAGVAGLASYSPSAAGVSCISPHVCECCSLVSRGSPARRACPFGVGGEGNCALSRSRCHINEAVLSATTSLTMSLVCSAGKSSRARRSPSTMSSSLSTLASSSSSLALVAVTSLALAELALLAIWLDTRTNDTFRGTCSSRSKS